MLVNSYNLFFGKIIRPRRRKFSEELSSHFAAKQTPSLSPSSPREGPGDPEGLAAVSPIFTQPAGPAATAQAAIPPVPAQIPGTDKDSDRGLRAGGAARDRAVPSGAVLRFLAGGASPGRTAVPGRQGRSEAPAAGSMTGARAGRGHF